MKRVAFAILLFALPTVAKDKDKAPAYAVNCDDPKSYSCNQYLQLEVRQQKALDAFAAFQAAQRDYQNDVNDLEAEAKKIEQENGWPDDLKFNDATLTFDAVPPAPEKK